MAEFMTLGEPMVVLIPRQTGSFEEVETFGKGLAGAELNVSIGVTRLGHSAAYVSALGEDIFGEYILHQMEKLRIDTSFILRDPNHLTGAYFKTKVTEGDPSVHYLRKNSAASCIGPKQIDKISMENVKWLHVTGIMAAVSESCYQACVQAIKKAHEQKIPVSFDPNIRISLWPSAEIMAEKLNALAFLSDIVLPGVSEGRLLTGKDSVEEIADFYLSGNAGTVIVKAGGTGAYYKTLHEPLTLVSGFHPERIVDTVGAGDAFAAGVITGQLEGLSIRESVRRGNAMGARMLEFAGDNEGLPTREELTAFMKNAE